MEQQLKSLSSQAVIKSSFSTEDYVFIDLSVNNISLKKVDVSSSLNFGNYIDSYLNLHHAKVAYGGYLEQRNIYSRSNYFNTENTETERNIHLGIDLWIVAETPIYSPLDGVVHSFKNNIYFGDYGPTVVLEHNIQGVSFYTLYGHLSLASIENISVGQAVKQGEQIATLGDVSVNGDYPPHLHFQIIKDMQGFTGDYPGVCSQQDLEFYRMNCPNPNLLLKL